MNIFYQSQKFIGKTDLKERWYDIEYKQEDIRRSLIEQCTNIEHINPSLHFPIENPFIPRDFTIVEEQDQNLTEFPIKIRDDQRCSIWYKKDQEFKQPRVNIFYNFVIPATQSSPHYTIMATLYTKIVRDRLNEILYFADLSDFDYHVQHHDTGFIIRLGGYNDKISNLNKIIFDKMVDRDLVLADRFQVLKEKLLQHLKNKEKDQPYQHAIDELTHVQFQQKYSNHELYESLQQISYEYMAQFIPIWLSALRFDVLVHGNFSRSDSLALVAETEKLFSNSFIPPTPEKRVIQLQSGKRYIRQMTEFNTENKNSALEVLYRVGIRNTRTEALVDLLVQIMSNAFFSTLRTIEQIGYIVFCRVRHDHNVVSVALLLQSSEKDPIFMLDRCNIFVQKYFETITSLTQEEFEKNVKSLIVKKLEKDKNLTQQSNHYLKEIVDKQFKFDRKQVLVEEIAKLTRQDLIDFYQTHLLSDQKTQLIVQVFANGHEDFNKSRSENDIYIDDVVKFKNNMDTYPAFVEY
jgi:insulysin